MRRIGFGPKGWGWLPGTIRPVAGRRSCERTYMKSTSESLSHPETSNGRAAGGNCVVARRGGEQPEADLRSQTRVNPIRFTTTASLRATGEACRMSGNRFLPHPSFTGENRVVVDGWGENAGKVSCGSVESCPGRNPRERGRAAVRAAIVVRKRGNARGAKGGRKWNHGRKHIPSDSANDCPRGLEPHGLRASGWPIRPKVCRKSTPSKWRACRCKDSGVPTPGREVRKDRAGKMP
jgi:hypothetical protein